MLEMIVIASVLVQNILSKNKKGDTKNEKEYSCHYMLSSFFFSGVRMG
jgi:hypothetical protein